MVPEFKDISNQDSIENELEAHHKAHVKNFCDNVVKRATSLGIENPRQLAIVVKEAGLDFNQAYISKLWNYDPDLKETPNISMKKQLVLACALECSVYDLCAYNADEESVGVSKLPFTGKFHDTMVEACTEAMQQMVSMERIQFLKPVQSHDIVDLQFSSFNRIINKV